LIRETSREIERPTYPRFFRAPAPSPRPIARIVRVKAFARFVQLLHAMM
jgi:hypothetical protein